MLTIGKTFRAAREKKQIDLSRAASLTRIKIQHLEMMERDDFSRMPAPTYAKGFIRIYADLLGLDPEPLVREYVEEHLNAAADERPGRVAAPRGVDKPLPPPPPPPPPPPEPEPEEEALDRGGSDAEDSLFTASTKPPSARPRRRRSTGRRAGMAWTDLVAQVTAAFAHLRPIAPRAGGVVLGVLLLVGLLRCMSGSGPEPETPGGSAPGVPRLGPEALATEPPVRYLELPNPEEPSP